LGVSLSLVWEVDAGHYSLQEAAGEDRDHDMRGLGSAAGTRNRTGLDGHEGEPAALHGPGALEAGEAVVERQVFAVVFRVVVAARPVGLPDLDQAVADRTAVAVRDAPGDYDPLP
jgi:hypothetical protein